MEDVFLHILESWLIPGKTLSVNSASITLTHLGLCSRFSLWYLEERFLLSHRDMYLSLDQSRKYMDPKAILKGNLCGSVKIRWHVSQHTSVWLNFRFRADSALAELQVGVDPHDSIEALEQLWKKLHQFSKAYEIRTSAGVSQHRSVAVNRITVVHISWRAPHCIFFFSIIGFSTLAQLFKQMHA